ncbi:uncharacterized protein LOC135367006 [Ornithodoros turicata]|uniref:uncharacterized protein LOC135367006 n=1 Tax=Ornithodoros turicata TaxID=34597 RepID=UPI0031390A59
MPIPYTCHYHHLQRHRRDGKQHGIDMKRGHSRRSWSGSNASQHSRRSRSPAAPRRSSKSFQSTGISIASTSVAKLCRPSSISFKVPRRPRSVSVTKFQEVRQDSSRTSPFVSSSPQTSDANIKIHVELQGSCNLVTKSGSVVESRERTQGSCATLSASPSRASDLAPHVKSSAVEQRLTLPPCASVTLTGNITSKVDVRKRAMSVGHIACPSMTLTSEVKEMLQEPPTEARARVSPVTLVPDADNSFLGLPKPVNELNIAAPAPLLPLHEQMAKPRRSASSAGEMRSGTLLALLKADGAPTGTCFDGFKYEGVAHGTITEAREKPIITDLTGLAKSITDEPLLSTILSQSEFPDTSIAGRDLAAGRTSQGIGAANITVKPTELRQDSEASSYIASSEPHADTVTDELDSPDKVTTETSDDEAFLGGERPVEVEDMNSEPEDVNVMAPKSKQSPIFYEEVMPSPGGLFSPDENYDDADESPDSRIAKRRARKATIEGLARRLAADTAPDQLRHREEADILLERRQSRMDELAKLIGPLEGERDSITDGNKSSNERGFELPAHEHYGSEKHSAEHKIDDTDELLLERRGPLIAAQRTEKRTFRKTIEVTTDAFNEPLAAPRSGSLLDKHTREDSDLAAMENSASSCVTSTHATTQEASEQRSSSAGNGGTKQKSDTIVANTGETRAKVEASDSMKRAGVLQNRPLNKLPESSHKESLRNTETSMPEIIPESPDIGSDASSENIDTRELSQVESRNETEASFFPTVPCTQHEGTQEQSAQEYKEFTKSFRQEDFMSTLESLFSSSGVKWKVHTLYDTLTSLNKQDRSLYKVVYNPDFLVRQADEYDLSDIANKHWEHITICVPETITTFFNCHPRSFFVCVDKEGMRSGIICIIVFGGGVACCCINHAKLEYSEDGVRRMLWDAILDIHKDLNIFAMVPAERVHVYHTQLGFYTSREDFVLHGKLPPCNDLSALDVPLKAGLTVKPFDMDMLPELVEYDKTVLGFARKLFWEYTVYERSLTLHIAVRNGKVQGYAGLQYDIDGALVLRWLFAEDTNTACRLLYSLLHGVEKLKKNGMWVAFHVFSPIARSVMQSFDTSTLKPWMLIFNKREPFLQHKSIAVLTCI